MFLPTSCLTKGWGAKRTAGWVWGGGCKIDACEPTLLLCINTLYGTALESGDDDDGIVNGDDYNNDDDRDDDDDEAMVIWQRLLG